MRKKSSCVADKAGDNCRGQGMDGEREERRGRKSFSLSSPILTPPETCQKIASSCPEWLIRWISPRARPEEEEKETI